LGVTCVSIQNLGICFYFCEKCHWSVYKDCTESVVALGSMVILAILIFPAYEHKTSCRLFIYSSTYFISDLLFLMFRCSASKCQIYL
jgi:hypothetical protein